MGTTLYRKSLRQFKTSKMIKSFLAIFCLSTCSIFAYGQSCGQSTVSQRPNRIFDDGSRIVGGVEAKPFSFPWIVSLQQGGGHFCGGSLIRVGNSDQSDIVVTAAHCVYDGFRSTPTASAGAHDLYRPTQNQQTVRVKLAHHHHGYNPDTTLNDIAVVVLEKPIKFTKSIQPICLPSSGESVSEGTEATVAGWGLTRENGGDVSNVLNQVGVPVVGSRNCASMYGKKGIRIDADAMICAGYSQGGKDACQGDSGGPFMTKRGSSYTLQGVVSFGIGCARPGLPGVYARVSNYVGWLNEKIRQYSKV